MKSATRVLLALVAGLAAGMAIATLDGAATGRAVELIGVVGTLWINAIRMTVLPLVTALTVTSVANIGATRALGTLGMRALIAFVVVLVLGGAFTAVVAPLVLGKVVIGPETAAALKASVTATATAAGATMPTLTQRLIETVPVNPIKAAADGAILPLVVFALAIGLALARVAEARRAAVLSFAQTVADAMLVLVGWILRAAPIGVFALALVLGARMGAQSAGAVLYYVAALSSLLFAFTVMLYPIAIVVGRVAPRAFVTALLPAQAVALSVRSSLAALPALIAGARDVLRLPASATGFVLPLAVSTFRVNVPIAWVVGVIFLGKLYGVPVTQGDLAMLVVTATLLSFSVPGIPSASLFLLSPVLVQHGIPAEGVGILIAVDAIPDMFKTLANVTAHVTAAVVATPRKGA